MRRFRSLPGPARGLALLALLAAALTAPAQAQDPKTCAFIMLPSRAAPGALPSLGRKVQTACAPRTAGADLDKQVRDLRRQGFKRIVLAGHGPGANAAMAFAGTSGDVEAVIALGGDVGGEGGDLPRVAAGIKQHVPLLWVVGAQDPLAARGEAYAFAKAPPHPASRYVSVEGDAAATPDAAARAVLEWIKSLD